MKTLSTLLAASLLSFNALAGIVVLGHPSGVDALSQNEVQNLFMGKSTKLSNGANAQIVELNDGAAGRIAFHQVATGRSEAQIQSGWARLVFTGKAQAPIQVANDAAVVTTIAGNPNAIGYVDESAVTADVKVLLRY
ncbi:phosphate ABC transporter substrate-binding protein [Vibrio sp. SM6]|uniref:Phosphate ABC transporter substrate-binding protein n=1 Tax=Vibrio agarilyticus TaxID=2726741 RepID=A0A7X8TP50_9VIBR|nr:phosphate ABC transporter substrate-binding protein [Vibrio agarilyticus]NLS12357.1 phosphate ABC transporter substrate-binding protein [Vibrio agarilyticus]